jgi:hypothetical protein
MRSIIAGREPITKPPTLAKWEMGNPGYLCKEEQRGGFRPPRGLQPTKNAATKCDGRRCPFHQMLASTIGVP